MFEFRIHSQQKKSSHSPINLTNHKVNPKNSMGVYNPRAYNLNSVNEVQAVNFKNMQANLKNAKRGCRSCNGTF